MPTNCINTRIIKPNEGFQRNFIRSNVDVVIGGGALNAGKSYAALLMLALHQNDPNFSAVFLRNNIGDLKAGGGLLGEARKLYGKIANIVESGDPHMTFNKSGARVDFTHIADQTKTAVERRFKGRQYDLIYFDEGTGFTWDCFKTVCTRNRGTAQWTNKIRMTTNPKKSHWLRVFLDWYIGADGFIREDRNGVVRYFFVNGDNVEDVVFGDSKYEVYHKCKIKIDSLVSKANGKRGKHTWDEFILSTVFYLGRMSENIQSLDNNKGYLASVAMGGKDAEVNIEGNWNVDPEEDEYIPIKSSAANSIFDNDSCINNDLWITADLATVGKDNFVALVWNGFHICDIKILRTSTPRQNAEVLKSLAINNGIGFSHIIFDGINGQYINDYIPEAIPFLSYCKPIGMDKYIVATIKDESYKRLCYMINNQLISIAKSVSEKRYVHKSLKSDVSVRYEFVDEATAVRFKVLPNGKQKLWSKDAMNALLGKDRSMDLLDPCAMRMMPILQYEYGEELSKTMAYRDFEEENNIQINEMLYGDNDFSCNINRYVI